RPTIQQLVTDDWLPSIDAQVAAGTLRAATASQHRHLITGHVLPTLGGTYLASLSPTQLNKLYGQLLTSGRKTGGGLSPATVHAVHVTIRKALGDAVRWGRLARNAATLADPPQPARPEMRTWSAEEERAFLTQV